MSETTPVYHTTKTMEARIKVLNDIPRERARQEEIHPEEIGLWEMFGVVVEELGELAQAMQKHYLVPGTKTTDKDNLYEEAIHLSAAAARFAEKVINHA